MAKRTSTKAVDSLIAKHVHNASSPMPNGAQVGAQDPATGKPVQVTKAPPTGNPTQADRHGGDAAQPWPKITDRPVRPVDWPTGGATRNNAAN